MMENYKLRDLHKKRKKRITKKLQKIYWGECSAEHLQRTKMKVFRKKNRLDCKAVELARKIHYAPYCASAEGETLKRDTPSLWEEYMAIKEFDGYDFKKMKALLSAIRKAVVDGFDIENTYLHEIPYADDKLLVADFVNKEDYDNYHWHKKEIDIRSISFDCYYDRLFAQPVKQIEEGGVVNCHDVRTCQEAVSVIG